MTYFSDFDYTDNYNDPMVRDRIIREVEEEYTEASEETVPWDLLEDY